MPKRCFLRQVYLPEGISCRDVEHTIMEKRLQNVLIDADACPVPVKLEIIKLAQKRGFEPVFVTSYAHASSNRTGGKWVLVDSVAEEVDLYLVNHVKRNDIVVTQDHGLASLLLPKGVYVLSPRGKQFLEQDMDQVLYERYLSAKQRRAGNRTKGPSKYTDQDIECFSKVFQKILSKIEGT